MYSKEQIKAIKECWDATGKSVEEIALYYYTENAKLYAKCEEQKKVLEMAKKAMKYINVWFLNTGAFRREYEILQQALTAIDEVSHE